MEDTGETLELAACSSDDSDSEGSQFGGQLEPPPPPAPAPPAAAPATAATAAAAATAAPHSAAHSEGGGHALFATDVSGQPYLIH